MLDYSKKSPLKNNVTLFMLHCFKVRKALIIYTALNTLNSPMDP